jgi:uncharacterized protein with GYD domain
MRTRAEHNEFRWTWLDLRRIIERYAFGSIGREYREHRRPSRRQKEKRAMQTFFMFGSYSEEALDNVSAKRTKDVSKLVDKAGGKVKSIHALLGDVDLVIIVEMPGIEEMMKLSAVLSRKTGIAFASYPAVSVEAFDKLLE